MGNKLTILFFNCFKDEVPNTIPGDFYVENYDIDYADVDDDELDAYFTPPSEAEEEHQQESAKEYVKDEPENDVDNPMFVCGICTEERELWTSFNVKGCAHFYCIDCTVKLVISKLDDNLLQISCPEIGCHGALEPEYCRGILPGEVFERWGNALCEGSFEGVEKLYCPYEDCSALMVASGGEMGKVQCRVCNREFCSRCKVAWHAEVSCSRFRRLRKRGEEGMLVDLVRRKQWRRCPKCRFFIEKSSGCSHMHCRCGHSFCYKCGRGHDTRFNRWICRKFGISFW